MSNDSTVSETTPLRRSDSREIIIGHTTTNNNHNLLSTPPTALAATTTNTVTTTATAAAAAATNVNGNTNNKATNATICVTTNALENIGDSLLNRSTRNRTSYNIAVQPASAASSSSNTNNANKNNRVINHTIAIAANNNNFNNNNNNVEVRLSHNLNNNNNNNNHTQTKMDTNKRILCRIGLDVLILLCVGFPILFFFLFGVSYERGFFCDDESLKHPFKESTIKSWMLYVIGLVIPIAVITGVEIVRAQQKARASNGNHNARRYMFMDYEIPDWLVECYKKIGVFGFGVAITQLATDIAKYSIGRLRPHFFAVCDPIINDGTTCSDAINIGRYIENYKCNTNGSADERMLKEVRLSFPSGHSSFSFFTMVYLALYLQARMTWRGSKLLRHFLQFAFIMIAWYTALSRVSDYKHHWSDVLAGTVIGSLSALIVANYISDLFREHVSKSYMLPRTTQDAHAAAHHQTTTTPVAMTATNGH